MFSVDNRTILLVLIFVGIISTSFSFFPSIPSRKKIMNSFRAANIFYIVGFTLLLFQNILPQFISIIIANILILLNFCFYSKTASQLFGNSFRLRLILILIAVHTLLFLFFTYIHFNTFLRIILISVEIIFIQFYSLLKIIKVKQGQNKRILNLLIITQSGYISISIFRIVLTTLTHNNIDSIFSLDVASSIIFLGSISYQLIMNLIFIISLILKYDTESLNRAQLLQYTHKRMLDLNKMCNRYFSENKSQILYESICNFFTEQFSALGIAIFLKKIDDDYTILEYSSGLSDDLVKSFKRLPIDDKTSTGLAIIRQKPIILSTENHPNSALKLILVNYDISYIASYPFKTSLGVTGVFTMGFNKRKLHLKKDKALFHLICLQMGSIIENALLYESLHIKASIDSLTGVLNRRELLNRMKQLFQKAKRNSRIISVLMLDIDHFKLINDTYGHDAGDFTLKEIVKLISKDLRQEDLFGRYGGEEFVIALEDTDSNKALEISERIRKRIESFVIEFRDFKFSFTVSIGITILKEKDNNIQEIITRADEKLYIAKQNGKNRSKI